MSKKFVCPNCGELDEVIEQGNYIKGYKDILVWNEDKQSYDNVIRVDECDIDGQVDCYYCPKCETLVGLNG